MFRSSLEHVKQRRDEGVDAGAEVLEIDEHDVEHRHRRIGRAAHLAIEAEDRNAEDRIIEVRRLLHVVLLVAAQAVLRPERRRQLQAGRRRQRVERMGEIARDGGRMCQKAEALSGQRAAKFGLREEPVQTEFHTGDAAGISTAKQSSWWKSGLPGGCASAQ